MENWTERTELLLGSKKFLKLQNANILVVGLGGVGSYACEALCRAGIGKMTIVDGDTINPSNRNRQIQALKSTEGQKKALVLQNRLLDINPEINLQVISDYVPAEKMQELLSQKFDFVVDAIDTLAPKIELIDLAVKNNHRIVSSMGAGGKIDATQIQIADISKTYNCPLARILRKRLHRRGIRKGFTAVFSSEKPDKKAELKVEEKNKKTTHGTISYLPAIFGNMCASVVVNELLKNNV